MVTIGHDTCTREWLTWEVDGYRDCCVNSVALDTDESRCSAEDVDETVMSCKHSLTS